MCNEQCSVKCWRKRSFFFFGRLLLCLKKGVVNKLDLVDTIYVSFVFVVYVQASFSTTVLRVRCKTERF